MARPLRPIMPRTGDTLADEELLLDYLRHVDACNGWSATHVGLSRLSPFHRRDHHLRLAADGFTRLATDDHGQLFRLGNGDLLFFFPDATRDRVSSELHRLTMLFADDPLLRDPPAGHALARTYTTSTDLGSLVDIVRPANGTRAIGDRAGAADATAAPEGADPAARRRGPVPPALLAKLDRALTQTDISSFVRRRPVCRIEGERAVPVLTRLSVSLADLSAALLTDSDIAASRAVARWVGESIDRRLLALLGRSDDEAASAPVAVPLAVSTLMSDAFRRFDDHVFRARRRTIVLEIDVTDIFDNIEDARFACRLARQRGYRILSRRPERAAAAGDRLPPPARRLRRGRPRPFASCGSGGRCPVDRGDPASRGGAADPGRDRQQRGARLRDCRRR